MSLPDQILRWAGDWDVTRQYVFCDMVLYTPTDRCYVSVSLTAFTGGAVPPSNPDWVIVPISAGGTVSSVTSDIGSGIVATPTTGAVVVSTDLVAGTGIQFVPSAIDTSITANVIFPIPPVPPTNLCGIYTEEAEDGPLVVVIPIVGLTSTGIVLVTLVHPGTGGGPQYIKTIVPTTDTLTLTMNQSVEVGDGFIWLVANL